MRSHEPSFGRFVFIGTERRKPDAASAIGSVLNPHVALEVDDSVVGVIQDPGRDFPMTVCCVFQEHVGAACCAEVARQDGRRFVWSQGASIGRRIGRRYWNVGGEKYAGNATGDITMAKICRKRERRVWHTKGVLICAAMT